jgi:hypothetical protein
VSRIIRNEFEITETMNNAQFLDWWKSPHSAGFWALVLVLLLTGLYGWGMARYETKIQPDYPLYSSGDKDPVRVGRRARAGVDRTLGHGVQVVASVEAVGEAGQVALGVLGADVMVGAGERGLEVAQRRVDPAALAAPIAQRAPSATAQG